MPKSPKPIELAEEPFFFKYPIEQLPDAVFCLGADARFFYLNNAACEKLEYSRRELLSMTLRDIDPNFSLESWSKQWQELSQKGSLEVKSQYRTKSGKYLLVEFTLIYVKEGDREFGCAFAHRAEASKSIYRLSQFPLEKQYGVGEQDLRKTQPTVTIGENAIQFDSNGNIKNLTREISQLREAEAQLTKTLSLVRGTLDSAAYGIIAVSYEGEVISYNRQFIQMWEIPDSLVLSNDSECQNFFARQLKNPEIFRRSVWEISRESKAETYDILELKDGRVFTQYSKPQRLDDKIIGRVWSIYDITKFKQQTESELQKTKGKIETLQAIEEAKELSELRSRFLSMLCHQFRSSLNIISFSNSFLKRYVQWTDNKELPYLDNIQTAVEQIAKLLDELVFFGRSEVGQLEFKPQPIDLASFCQETIAQIQPLKDEKQQTIEFTNTGDCQTVCADKNILYPILTNLLSNAIKYSPNNSKIELEVLCDREQVVLKVRDKGIGISAVDQQRLFDPFFRGDNVDDIPGHGLGLAIARNLAVIHEGKLEVESKIGIGTTFLLTIATKKDSCVEIVV